MREDKRERKEERKCQREVQVMSQVDRSGSSGSISGCSRQFDMKIYVQKDRAIHWTKSKVKLKLSTILPIAQTARDKSQIT